MPIIEGQKNLIRSAIDFLFDFPEDKNELIQQINLIKEALVKEVPEEHDYHALRKFFFYPTENLHGIEKFDNEFTVAEVQLAVLDVCLESLKEAAKDQLDIYEGFKNWISQVESVLIQPQHREEKFSITQPSQAQVNFPWVNMRGKDEVFSCSLLFNTETNCIDIVVSVDLPNNKNFRLTTQFVRPNPEILASHISVLNNYYFSLIPAAKLYAYDYAKRKIIDYLYQERYINDEEYEETYKNPTVDRIICHEYYLDQICDDEIDITFLNILTEHGVNVFCNESMIELLEAECCTIEDAVKILPHHLQLITSYYKGLRDESIDIHQILEIPEENSTLMQMPFVINFVPFEIAVSLPVYLTSLFKNSIFTEYFSNHPIDFESLKALTETQCNFINNKDISLLIANETLSLKTITEIEPEMHATLRRPKINRLFANSKISVTDLQDMSINAIKMTEEHPYIAEWLTAGVIKPDAIQPKKLTKFYAKVYAERLFSLQQDHPYVLHGKEDDIYTISEEINAAAYHAEITIHDLQEFIIKRLIEKFKHALISVLAGDISKEETRACKKLIAACSDVKASWNDVLIKCIQKANNILNDFESRSRWDNFDLSELRLFKPKNYPTDRPIYKFCTGMLRLAELAAGLPQQKAQRHESSYENIAMTLRI